MTTDDLRALLAAATRVPWIASTSGDILTHDREWIVATVAQSGQTYGSKPMTIEQEEANAALIVAAVNLLPAHLDLVEAATIARDEPDVPSDIRDRLRAALARLEAPDGDL